MVIKSNFVIWLLFSPDTQRWFQRPDWWVVIVATITAGVIVWQVIEMRRATDAMKENTDVVRNGIALQQTAMKQWVVLKNWAHDVRMEAPDVWMLTIRCEVCNASNYPMTLITTAMQVENRERMAERMANHNIPLAPTVAHGIETQGIPIDYKAYLDKGSVTFVVFGAVWYLDCFDKIQTFPFSGTLWCAKNRQTTFTMEYYYQHPFAPQQKPEEHKAAKA